MSALAPTSSSPLGLGRPSTTPSSKRRHPRESSGAYAKVFDPAQVQTFREAFTLMDQDNDGLISTSDLKGLLESLGQCPTPSLLASLLPPPSTSLNFTAFVTAMSSHLSSFDSEPDLLEAFASFDEGNTGFVKEGEVREALGRGWGKDGVLEDEEISRFLHPPFLDPRTGLFNYRAFCATLRVVEPDEDEGGATSAAGQY